MAYNKDINTL